MINEQVKVLKILVVADLQTPMLGGGTSREVNLVWKCQQ